jgi:hypothetical protein
LSVITPGQAVANADGSEVLEGIQITRLIAGIVVLLPSLALAHQPLPQPKPAGPGGSCPHGYTASGSFCVRVRAPGCDPVAAELHLSAWTRSGSFSLRSGGGR